MIDYQPLFHQLRQMNAESWADQLPDQIELAFDTRSHGSVAGWLNTIQNLPVINPEQLDFDVDAIKIGIAEQLSSNDQKTLKQALQSFHPWRKGPYDIYGIQIDTEWRSDWKWQRLEDHIEPLKNRLVLDVGCGNGYHCWRMYGNGARMVVGVDPLLLNVVQFQVVRQLAGEVPVFVLPVGIEHIPESLTIFDSVFSMGVLYHRRSPIDHLLELKGCLRPGGELVLETLVIDGELGDTLLPEDRYAKMRNVWFLPSCQTLLSWMDRCGYINCRVIDVSVTTTDEQRATEWMQFYSLQNFLDPDNPSLTCEGLPAPKRAIIIANVP